MAVLMKKYGCGQHARPFTVAIEGNIGSGKTTLLRHFEKVQALLLPEPVNKWRNVDGVNLLAMMYSNPKKWAMPFQSYVTLTMLQNHMTSTTKPIKMMERSLFSSKWFVENMHRNEILEPGMYAVLKTWYAFIEETMPSTINVDLFIYLRTSPKVAYERIRRRARPEEQAITLKYLQELHTAHEDWLKTNSDANIIILNGDLDIDQIVDEYRVCEEKIMNRIL